MSDHQLNGGIEQGKGRVKQVAGALMGDLKTEASGRAQELRGQAESLYGEAIERLGDLASERPAAALAGAFGLGLVIGLFLARG